MAHRHYRVRLHVREPYDEDADSVVEAARDAAAAAARTLAERDYGGESASVEYEVVYQDRTVPTQAPQGHNSPVVEVHRTEPEDLVADEDSEELSEEDEVEYDYFNQEGDLVSESDEVPGPSEE